MYSKYVFEIFNPDSHTVRTVEILEKSQSGAEFWVSQELEKEEVFYPSYPHPVISLK